MTGAARERGIGRGIAQCLAEEGCDVAINDVGAEDEAAELVAELQRLGRRAAFFPADVSDRAAVDEMVAAVESELGPLDIVCSNAGVADWQGFLDVTEESFDRLVSRQPDRRVQRLPGGGAPPWWPQARPGRIVVTSSVHVQMPFAGDVRLRRARRRA